MLWGPEIRIRPKVKETDYLTPPLICVFPSVHASLLVELSIEASRDREISGGMS